MENLHGCRKNYMHLLQNRKFLLKYHNKDDSCREALKSVKGQGDTKDRSLLTSGSQPYRSLMVLDDTLAD